mmetsp:Transcript_64462/g.186843  ORF Transcript_64462/g.186843 Transcript_64462/m.186843 type:complete len:301 (+) Transcript_64462:794-1696(+)
MLRLPELHTEEDHQGSICRKDVEVDVACDSPPKVVAEPMSSCRHVSSAGAHLVDWRPCASALLAAARQTTSLAASHQAASSRGRMPATVCWQGTPTTSSSAVRSTSNGNRTSGCHGQKWWLTMRAAPSPPLRMPSGGQSVALDSLNEASTRLFPTSANRDFSPGQPSSPAFAAAARHVAADSRVEHQATSSGEVSQWAWTSAAPAKAEARSISDSSATAARCASVPRTWCPEPTRSKVRSAGRGDSSDEDVGTSLTIRRDSAASCSKAWVKLDGSTGIRGAAGAGARGARTSIGVHDVVL